MSRRTRILLALLAVYALGMAALLYQLLADLDPRYRESAEEGLIETAQLMATVIEQEVEQGALPTDRIAAIFRDDTGRRLLEPLSFKGIEPAQDKDWDEIRRLNIQLPTGHRGKP